MSITKSGLDCLYCVQLYRFIELCIFLCHLVLFILVISFVLKGFSTELFIVMIYCNVFLTHNIVNFFINFTCLTATYLSKACYSLFVPDVPLNPSQSINLVLRVSIMSL